MTAARRDEAWLLAPTTIYLCLIGGLLFNTTGVVLGLLSGVAIAVFGHRLTADTMQSLYRAEPIAPAQGRALRQAIADLSERAGLLSSPAIAVVPSVAIGAFSVGSHNRTAILLTEGLLRRFNIRQIATIAAHEIAHIKAGDLRFFALADTITRVAQLLCYLGVILSALTAIAWLLGENFIDIRTIGLLLIAVSLNSQLQLYLPRQREYAADRTAAQLLGDSDAVAALALAMEPDGGSPLDDFRLPVPQRRSPIPSPARAHLLGSERVDQLRSGAQPLPLPPLAITDEPLVSLVGVGPIEMRPRNRWPGLWF